MGEDVRRLARRGLTGAAVGLPGGTQLRDLPQPARLEHTRLQRLDELFGVYHQTLEPLRRCARTRKDERAPTARSDAEPPWLVRTGAGPCSQPDGEREEEDAGSVFHSKAHQR